MFPQQNICTDNIVENEKAANYRIGKSFLFDFKTGDFILQDGKLVKAGEIQGIKIWIEKILKTQKFKFKIYEKQDKKREYGVTIKDLLIGNKYPRAFVESELKREITEALLMHPKIESIENFKFQRKSTTVILSFKVNLISDEFLEQEVRF